MDRSVFTIATGSESFFKMAINLARSFEYFNAGNNDIAFYIFTDVERRLPSDLKHSRLSVLKCDDLRIGFSIKLLIDRFAPTMQSIFIDADCFVLGSVEPLFDAFSDSSVGIFGEVLCDGERFGNVSSYNERLGISFMPNFNGGIYYIDKSREAKVIFAEARQLEPRYDDVGFVRLRGQPNDEMLIGAALAKNAIYPVPNDGRYYADFQWWPDLIEFDVLKGRCVMRNPPAPDPRRQERYPAAVASPLVVHFLGQHVDSAAYKRAALTLALNAKKLPFPGLLSSVFASPYFIEAAFKNRFRRVFRAMFGVRQIRRSRSRLVIEE
ncbi:hypothetical protein M2323_002159 [Rhodoblastus acidophilus]|uniref:hypothetical protein n=1 Tax=Rhodoblastus acidophilus TaxID=1074 RepID=UPI002225155B|nr:hypothetical protein [Rhodoblastus acidophilus]MCW2284292.1 hypothetical protein [Rhodoblastus acidophilus]MCW2333230.1 hypothetical protein [Rhodoblastus acidophilus]